MSHQRANRFLKVCEWVGPSAVVIDKQEGWPGLAEIVGTGGARGVAIHVSRVSPHSRRDYEYRFQNPADGTSRVVAPIGFFPILVGIAEHAGKPILVVTDGRSRLGRKSRFSILFDVSIVAQASIGGWAEYVSSTGEHIVAMQPVLLPAFVDALANDVTLDPLAVEDAAAASGLLDAVDEQSSERTRIAVTRLVRRAAFGKEVCGAYDNRCAMCDLGLSLPEGAHIYPASAPGSSDAVWNGLALCRNHHRLFDLRKIWIAPNDRRVVWHPEIVALSQADGAVRNLLDNTQPNVRLPTAVHHRPRVAMYTQRYQLAPGQYEWAA